MIDIVVATNNQKKKEEIREILKDLDAKLLDLSDFPNVPPVEESGNDYDENAAEKARVAAQFTNRLTIADDSGLEVGILGGLPGIRSSRFAGPNATDGDNNSKLLSLLEGIPPEKRKARFICSIAVADPLGFIKVVRGSCEGLIGVEPKGNQGFGYDPLFVIPGYRKTLAQLGPEVKNKISHRAKALQKAKKVILEYLQKKSS